MAKQLNVAIIGCGGISGAHIPNILKTPEIRLVATMDVVEEGVRSDGRRIGARVRAEEGNADYYTTDLDRILSDPDIDAVLICSTHDTHADITIKACAAGKHIFVEKPPAMTLDEARRVQKAVHESGVQLMSGWWFKHSPVTKRLREVIRQPYYTLFTCRVSYEKPNDPEGPYGRDGILDNSGYNLHWIWHVMRSHRWRSSPWATTGNRQTPARSLFASPTAGLGPPFSALSAVAASFPNTTPRSWLGK